jgi:peptidyl-prolyl cis-trans isomerase SurA
VIVAARMRWWHGLFVVAVLLPARGGAEVVDRVVATIDGEPITAHELRQYRQEQNADRLGEDQVLEALITDRLLEREIASKGIAARDEEIDHYIEEVKARFGMDEERFKRALQDQKTTLEGYRARVKRDIEKAQLVNREIRQRVNVSPEEVQRYYDAHLDDYAVGERVKVRGILIPLEPGADEAAVERCRAKANEVRQMARDGRDFGALARQFSEGPGADKGGELGSFTRGELDPALEEVVFSLKPGEVSEPVQARGGFHLLKVDERVAPQHKPIKEVEDDIRKALYNEALEERFQQWLSRDLRQRHHIEVLN